VRYMVALEATSARRRGPEPHDTWQRWSPSQQGGEVRSHMARGSVWMQALLLVLTLSLYVGVPSLQGTDSGPSRSSAVLGPNFFY
jgi:hypothetical protein